MDVLLSIILWLIAHGHHVEDSLLTIVVSTSEGECFTDCGTSTVEPLKEEMIESVSSALLRHISFEHMSTSDLRAITRLSREAKLEKFTTTCFERLLDEGAPYRFTSPVPHSIRRTSTRDCNVFTISSRISLKDSTGGCTQSEKYAPYDWNIKLQWYRKNVDVTEWLRCFMYVDGGDENIMISNSFFTFSSTTRIIFPG